MGLLAFFGIFMMLVNYIERPHNDSGQPESWGRGNRDFHPDIPPVNQWYLDHRIRKWWEL